MAQGENEDIVRVCTRPIAWASCYDKTGKWVCMRITAVEEYKVHSVIEICDNARELRIVREELLLIKLS